MGICSLCECAVGDSVCSDCLDKWWKNCSSTKQLQADNAEQAAELEQLRAALQSIADQMQCDCRKSEKGDTHQRHSSACRWYIGEEAEEALDYIAAGAAEKEKQEGDT